MDFFFSHKISTFKSSCHVPYGHMVNESILTINLLWGGSGCDQFLGVDQISNVSGHRGDFSSWWSSLWHGDFDYIYQGFFGLLQYTNYLNPTHLWHFWFDWIDKRIAAKGLVNLRRRTAFLYHNVCHLLLDETRLKKSDMDCWFRREKLSPLVFFWCSLRTPLILMYFHVVSYFSFFFDKIYYHYVFNQLVNFVPVFFFVRFFHWTWIKNCTLWRDSPGYNALLSACDRAAETRQAMPGSSDSPCFFGRRWEKSGNVSQ